MSTSKKLKMERLSPILMANQAHATHSDSCRTPSWCITPKASIRKRKDRYAIESTSSPEVDIQRNDSEKHKKTRGSAVYNKIKSAPKKHAPTPLPGLLTRKSVCQPPRESTSVSDWASSGLNLAGRSVNALCRLPTIEEAQTFDDEMDQIPNIGAFNSPLKPRVLDSSRHSSRITPSLVYPSLRPSNPPNNTPLSNVITTASLDHNQSLNESIGILASAEVELCEENKVVEPDMIPPSIECFESPNKPPPTKYHKPTSFAKESFDLSNLSFNRLSLSKLVSKKEPLASIIEGTTSKFNSSVEMSGSERKTRKRALDFSSQTFPDSAAPGSPVSAVLLANLPSENRPKLGHKPMFDFLKQDSPLHQVEEVLNDDSDSESVIEGTPKSCRVLSRIKDDTLSGFTVCSSLAIDASSPPFDDKHVPSIHKSPPSASQPKIEIQEEASNDGFPGLRCDLNLVCHDSSSDQSEIEFSINNIENKNVIPSVSDVEGITNTPPLSFNCTRRKIQPYESPSKATRAFSEAVNIGAFGSPDSNASNNEPEEVVEKEVDEDIINVTTTQEEDEFVDESEQIRPSKRRKKGSLLERAGFIISRIDASNTLLDYEIKAGLRPFTGKFVSCSLVVCKKWAGENSGHFLVCKTLKYCKIESQEHSEAERTCIVAIIVNKIPKDLSEGSVVLLHYPLTIVYCDGLVIPCVLAGNQLVLDTNEPTFNNLVSLNIDDSLVKVLSRRTAPMKNIASSSSMKVFPFRSVNNLAEAALCQSLVDEFELSLRVLHVVKDYSDPTNKKVLVLCCDVEQNFGWVHFTQERDVKRATALEALHVLADGALTQVRGFHVSDRIVLDKKTRNLLNYCLNGIVDSDIIFILIAVEPTWVISSSGEPSDAKKTVVTIDFILHQKTRGERFLIEVASSGFDENQNIFVKDSHGKSATFIQGNLAPKVRFELLSTPFFLDGVYHYDGKIFSDEYTKIIRHKLPWAKLTVGSTA